jgi:hypothetical protein
MGGPLEITGGVCSHRLDRIQRHDGFNYSIYPGSGYCCMYLRPKFPVSKWDKTNCSKGTILAGIFVGWIELLTILVAGLVVPPEDIGTGQGFFSSSRAVGGTIAGKYHVK